MGYGLGLRFVNALAVFVCLVSFSSEVYAGAGKTILALGDSLTAGYGLAQSDAFPVQLQAALRDSGLPDVVVINGGVSGDTSAGGRARLDWLLAEPVDLVIVELGANDGLRGLDPAETRRNLDAILAKLTGRGILVLLSGMLAPPNLGEDYGVAFNSIYPDLAQKYGVALDPFFLQGVATVEALNQADGIHPNAQGVAIIVKRLVPPVVNLLTD
ncbi:arylesterase [Magnetovibrio blakemorei]|uniref:Arylesterase n=1 Tax=Magnetovibrio blakemorei TaxID=28181 RepID=A0A1E5Q3E2_9PROT|nr:arylesterase [Magnetovibrio blakemorei]